MQALISYVVVEVEKVKGKYYYQIDTYFPSSRTCSYCGEKTEITKKLVVRK